MHVVLTILGHFMVVFHISCCSIHFLKDNTLIERFFSHKDIRQTTEFSSWSLDFRLAMTTKKGRRAQLDKSGMVLGPMINRSVCSLAPYSQPECNFGATVQLESKLKAAPSLPQGCPPPNSICRNRTFLYFFGPVWQKLEIDLVPKSIRCAPLTPANHSSIGIKAPSTIHLFCPIFAPKTTTLQCFIASGFHASAIMMIVNKPSSI